MKVLILNGPNLNLTGTREKDIYGTMDYDTMCSYITSEASKLGIETDIFQSNSEGEIIDRIHSSSYTYDGIIINPGAYSHYSYAIYDALNAVDTVSVEVHLSNIYKREEFRRNSVTAPACKGVISGFGPYGYVLALNFFK